METFRPGLGLPASPCSSTTELYLRKHTFLDAAPCGQLLPTPVWLFSGSLSPINEDRVGGGRTASMWHQKFADVPGHESCPSGPRALPSDPCQVGQWHALHAACSPVVGRETDYRLPVRSPLCWCLHALLSWAFLGVLMCGLRQELLTTWQCKPEIHFIYCLAFNPNSLKKNRVTHSKLYCNQWKS